MKKVFLVPSLSRLGLQSGFCLVNPRYGRQVGNIVSASDTAQQVWSLRVQAFRRGSVSKTIDLRFTSSEVYLRSFDDQWDLPNEPADVGDDLYAVEYVPPDASNDLDRFLASDLEGQLLFMAPGRKWYASVINGLILERPKGHRFAPIFHTGHYFVNDAGFTTYVCLVNYAVGKSGVDDNNSMEFRLIRDDGAILGTVKKNIGYNSTFIASIEELLREAGARMAPGQHVNVHVRGGASQYAIYTIFQSQSSGMIGIEHSLAPHYYTEAVRKPETRAILHRNVFGGP